MPANSKASVDPAQVVERLRSTIERARSMPMSSSVVVNKAEVLALVGELQAMLSTSSEKDPGGPPAGPVSGAQAGADDVHDQASQERDRPGSESEVVRLGRQEVEALRLAAIRDCDELRQETDEYVDGRLAQLEVSLTKTLEAVNRGRERLHQRSGLEQLDGSDDGGSFAFPE